MPLTDWQVELDGGAITVGAGTVYPASGPITGLMGLNVAATDLDRTPRHGTVPGIDSVPGKLIGIPVHVWPRVAGGGQAGDAATVLANLRALVAGWSAMPDTFADLGSYFFDSTLEELELAVKLPGINPDDADDQLIYYGRPRGVLDDLTLLPAGEATALLTFLATDPFGYGEEVTLVEDTYTVARASTSTVNVNVVDFPGNVVTDRIEVRIGNNDATYDREQTFIAFGADGTGLSLGEGRAIELAQLTKNTGVGFYRADVHRRTLTRASSSVIDELVDPPQLIAPNPTWPILPPGDSLIRIRIGSVTGAPAGSSDIDVTITARPAYI